MATDLIGWAISLLSIFAAVVTALVKLLLWQFEKRLSERFTSQDEARKEASKHWEESFAKVLERQDKDAQAVQQLERAFLNFKADLPNQYTRREDWARGQSVIESKLDGLALRYENILLKGARND
ncbi:hypothetical protein [Pseudomonas citronellolis]|uniref:hypothetical protein n=1 Tax=Pseudomonas citronellolis TaxID=53408 RepID=UPI000778ED0F|nr:hypothetical protein [Pseudomonas citronellolis]AMO73834.1 hypothetical protein PcP3B5_03220 [Pseudomonas citronellolis]MCP1606445.1 putative membrane protein YccC [Pseudomonas citronellolis]MCP1657151.1 putative membrane protein YccC [Pseudomonas citronellolis]MCP1724116.1 putative membrane protein YccC [Pseudomonas citronellolis]